MCYIKSYKPEARAMLQMLKTKWAKTKEANQKLSMYIKAYLNLKGVAHTHLSMKSHKSSQVQGLGQDIRNLVVGVNVDQIDIASLNMITEKMEANINVLGLGM